jgi:hypothetical protein
MFKLFLTLISAAVAIQADRPKMDAEALSGAKSGLKQEGTVEKNVLPNKDDIAAEKGEKIEYATPDDSAKNNMNAALAGIKK